jgi:hypothetical protein
MKIEPGACIIISLAEPREKFWGLIEDLNSAGAIVRGIDLNSFDELIRMLAKNESGIFPSTIFFPLRRIERIMLDESNDYLPSLKEQFEHKSGVTLQGFLYPS